MVEYENTDNPRTLTESLELEASDVVLGNDEG